ncbi:40S ribosomal protein S17 [Histoplasma capsulatum var. duboisii H88]|uniref:40S ribosomal protein S17 n=1 Tax=Ajellomyces capsulatus (strain H88) TaxID=544711 RepID=A0A8A1LCH4_AJEC8|nr:40S ribosomal protein S17 [Histoplasma capsulatum var. duboisii H88]
MSMPTPRTCSRALVSIPSKSTLFQSASRRLIAALAALAVPVKFSPFKWKELFVNNGFNLKMACNYGMEGVFLLRFISIFSRGPHGLKKGGKCDVVIHLRQWIYPISLSFFFLRILILHVNARQNQKRNIKYIYSQDKVSLILHG